MLYVVNRLLDTIHRPPITAGLLCQAAVELSKEEALLDVVTGRLVVDAGTSMTKQGWPGMKGSWRRIMVLARVDETTHKGYVKDARTVYIPIFHHLRIGFCQS